MRFAMALDEQHHFACSGERVLPRTHRHGARMSRETGHAHVEPRGPRNRRDDAHRKSFVQQQRPLLDVRFDVGDHVLSAAIDIAPMIGIAAEFDQRLRAL